MVNKPLKHRLEATKLPSFTLPGRAASLSGKMPLMTNRGQPGAPKRDA